MTKPFLSFEDQMDYLQRNKNLVIADSEYAKNILKRIGYFSLIGGYKLPFKNPTTKKFKDGTAFEQIVALYQFDENLRELFLKYILKIERHLHSLLSYYFMEKYGEAQSEYLNRNNYSANPKYGNELSKLINKLKDLANNNNDYPYIVHQRRTYGNVPLWVLINAVTFGSLSIFYSFSKPDIKTKIAKNFDSVNEKQLEQYLIVITKFRNVCAHSERLYSYRTKNSISDTAIHKKLGIPKVGSQYKFGKSDLFAMVIAFRYLLPDEDFKSFKAALIQIIKQYQKTSLSIPEADLYSSMGFPSNWKKITVYKK